MFARNKIKRRKAATILLYGKVPYLPEGRSHLSTLFSLEVPRDIVDDMVAHARAELPNECCGLLAGRLPEASSSAPSPVAEAGSDPFPSPLVGEGQGGGARSRLKTALVMRRYPLTNQAGSPTEYLSDPDSLFTAFRDMRRLGLDVLAIYHSHPATEPVPSRKDIERNNYGAEVVHLIISLSGAEPRIRAWRLSSDAYAQADWTVIEPSP
jgi:proteasome lid subunit RPN8/RPN11